MTALTGNRYLDGNFGPVTEEITATDLPVTGTIPGALQGRYVRNGPNPVVPPDPATYHWFTGDGMVHGVRLRDGKAEWYRNRWVRSGPVAEALGEAGPGGAAVHGGMDSGPNTNAIGLAGRTFAIVEAGARPVELTYELDTIGRCDFDGGLPGGYTAHPKLDPVTGELHAVSYHWAWGNQVQYTVIGPDARVRRVVDIPTHGSPMLHDVSLTERSIVVYDLPVRFDLDMALGGVRFPYRWDPEYPARIGVLDRDAPAESIQWFDVEPCYVFHPLNAYEDGDQLVIDLVRHPKMFDADRLGPNEGAPTLERWTVDRTAGKVVEERIDDRGQEFPRVDERVVGRRHRYGYSAAARTDANGVRFDGGALLKHDVVARTVEARAFPSGQGIGEAVFVPSSPAAAEDDGWLLTLRYDAATDSSDLLILSAQDIAGDPIAAVHLPQRVPYGFHGNWIAD